MYLKPVNIQKTKIKGLGLQDAADTLFDVSYSRQQ